MRDRATLVITHRLVRMEEMDEILVLDAGRIVERGTHEQLEGRYGTYRRLLDVQRELLAVS
jgi:ABC-type multidrug transport system fused ATPase/permease subunit